MGNIILIQKLFLNLLNNLLNFLIKDLKSHLIKDANYMSTFKDINDLLEQTQLNEGFPFNEYDHGQDSDEPSLELRRKIFEAKSILDKFILDFKKFGIFLDENNLRSISSDLNILITKIDECNNTPKNNKNLRSSLAYDILKIINNLPDITKLNFYNTGSIKNNTLLELIYFVSKTHEAFSILDIQLILNNATVSEINEIIDQFTSIHNETLKSTEFSPSSIKIINTYKLLERISERSKRLEISQTINSLEEKAISMEKSIGLSANSGIFDAFKNEADSFKWKIIIYNIVIILFFLLILSTLLFLVFIMMFSDNFKYIKEIQFYGFYISLILFLSGFITYLINERSRLLKQQYYCKISYIELISLIPYATQINDKSKIDDLKINLAERYFQGPNFDSKIDDSKPSQLNEIIKLIKEINPSSK